MGAHLQLAQGQIRTLVQSEETISNMLSAENTIQFPAYEFFSEQAVVDQLTVNARKMEQKGQHVPIRYHNRNQIEEEQEELEIAG